jgi:hypothetical protein
MEVQIQRFKECMILDQEMLLRKTMLVFQPIKMLSSFTTEIHGIIMIDELKNNIFLIYMNNLPDPDKVVFKHSLYKFKTENDIGTIIIQKVQLLGDLKKFKFCPEFLLYICNLTEHLVGDNKFDKKKIVINIISSLFNLNINETELVSNSIEFLHSNNLIKKVEEKIEDGFITKINKIFHIGKKKVY